MSTPVLAPFAPTMPSSMPVLLRTALIATLLVASAELLPTASVLRSLLSFLNTIHPLPLGRVPELRRCWLLVLPWLWCGELMRQPRWLLQQWWQQLDIPRRLVRSDSLLLVSALTPFVQCVFFSPFCYDFPVSNELLFWNLCSQHVALSPLNDSI